MFLFYVIPIINLFILKTLSTLDTTPHSVHKEISVYEEDFFKDVIAE